MQVQGSKQTGWEVVVCVNGERKRALVNTGYGKTLVQTLKEATLGESISVKCIHGDMKP